MKLRTQLLAAFLCVICFVVVVGGVSWRAINDITRRTIQSANLEDGIKEMLVARMMNMRMWVDNNPEENKEIQNRLKKSLKYIDVCLGLMTDINRIEQMRRFKEGVKQYAGKMSEIAEAHKAVLDAAGALDAVGAALQNNFDKHLQDIVAASNKNTEYSIVYVNSYSSLMRTLVHVESEFNEFSGHATDKNWKILVSHMDKALAQANDCYKNTGNITEKQILDDLMKQLKAYFDGINRIKVFTERRAKIRAEAKDIVLKVAKMGEDISDDWQEVIKKTRENANIILTLVIVASLFFGIGIAILISFMVQKKLGADPSELGEIAKRVVGGEYDIDDGQRHIGVFNDLILMVNALKQHISNAQAKTEEAHAMGKQATEAMEVARKAQAAAESAKREGMLDAATQLEDVAAVCSSASEELSAQIEQSERGAVEQANRIGETAAAMDEMNSTVLEVAKNAGAAAEKSADTKIKAGEGAKIVNECVAAIKFVHSNTMKLKTDMAALSGHAQDINHIMGVIADIADQTNLLALNAAIEAARAGDAGRGFAVVADEVRKLAEKTMASTTDVSTAIQSIQMSTAESSKQVDATVEYVANVTQLAAKCGEALEAIVHMAEDTADQVRAIATASEEQSATSEEISKSIENVNVIAGETSHAMGEAAKAVADLAKQAQILGSLIAEMKQS